ncbi:F-box/LRR-repeat protein 4-like [Leguminivora glycinivorella]|uniref:F-box/LRR-repeat protein 4-like n=1 Tax=Leguminivora glycinivorella TaxID=1035111 RepID=UPI00201088BF|nr:F-box/LRR-repeat protein 4-like [Leguminivora glycinivorella]
MENMEEDPDLGMESESNRAVINSLNPDCWRLILNYLSIQELMQSETTCKDWQKLVLDHISHRQIMIMERECDENTLILRNSGDVWPSFKRWLKKCGPAVQELDANCQHFRDVVEVLRGTCPNLEVLRLMNLKKKLSPTTTHHFPKLTWLVFENCDEITDDCIAQFLTDDMTELAIISNKRVTGRFLANMPHDKMSRLVLRDCRALKFSNLVTNVDHLKKLTTLVLWKKNRSKIEIRNKLHLLLDKMPNLGEIGFNIDDMLSSNDEQDCLEESNVFFEAVCRLKKLHRFNANFEVWDRHLEALAKSCKDLLAVRLQCTEITRAGLDALCRHTGPQLYELDLSESSLVDDDIVACIRACPKLVWLDISYCQLSERAVQRVAAARRDMRADLSASKYASNDLNNLCYRLLLVVCRWAFTGNQEEIKDVLDLKYRNDGFVSDSSEY